jgi:hypothetical protein
MPSQSNVVCGRVRLCPTSTRNAAGSGEDPHRIRIPDPCLVAATWKIGLKGGFGLTAMSAFDVLH